MLTDLLFIFAHKGENAFQAELSEKCATVMVDNSVTARFNEARKMIENGIGLLPCPISSTEKTTTGDLLRFRVNGVFMNYRLIVLGVYIQRGKRVMVEVYKQLTNRTDGEAQETESLIGQILELSLEAFSNKQGSPEFQKFMDKIEQARLAIADA